jgi:hypothetical protein
MKNLTVSRFEAVPGITELAEKCGFLKEVLDKRWQNVF